MVPIVLFLDLDDFKIVNDTPRAMPPATRCWSPSATASSRSCGRRDMAARLGGDEFAVLLCAIRRT